MGLTETGVEEVTVGTGTPSPGQDGGIACGSLVGVSEGGRGQPWRTLKARLRIWIWGLQIWGLPWQMLYLISVESSREVSDRAHIPT